MADPVANKDLYEFSVLLREKDKTTVVVEPQTVLASSLEAARLIAARAVPEEHAEEPDRLDIKVRLFR